jgi:dynein heavy chain, axonemal
VAAAGLAKWVRAIVQYDEAMKVVKPKQAQLKEAQESSAAAQALWDSALERLRAVEAEMKKLMDEFEATKAEEERLKNQKDDCEKKFKRAGSLLEKLADEKISWQGSLANQRVARDNLVGDILVCSGIIAYLGIFSMIYRQDCIKIWINMIRTFNIKSNEEISLNAILGNAVKIKDWLIKKLPQDSFSIDNAIILENSERWPLMIDPQLQANIWIKEMEKDSSIKIVKPTMDAKVMSRTLENAVNMGNPVIFEDAGETFDPMLEPLLGKQIEKKGSAMYIKIGDTPTEYSSDFRFYVTTKLSRPHYSPEVCVKVTMLNFMVTQEGLEDQMLTIVVKHEEPKKYDTYNDNVTKKANNDRILVELQDKILNQIANSSADILEDDELVVTLDESKSQ